MYFCVFCGIVLDSLSWPTDRHSCTVTTIEPSLACEDYDYNRINLCIFHVVKHKKMCWGGSTWLERFMVSNRTVRKLWNLSQSERYKYGITKEHKFVAVPLSQPYTFRVVNIFFVLGSSTLESLESDTQDQIYINKGVLIKASLHHFTSQKKSYCSF